MSRLIFIGSLLLFFGIGVVAVAKKKGRESVPAAEVTTEVVAILEEESLEEEFSMTHAKESNNKYKPKLIPIQDDSEDFDELYRLFTVSSNRFPFVETVTYSSRVPWLKGRPAWIADYASHYKTSKHFIARSLNGRPDYFTQKVATGDRFNVLSADRELSFHLLVDLSRCKMWFYAIDLDDNMRYLIKTYRVGLGRLDNTSPSGSLTPTGRYLLGEKIALYKPGVRDYFRESEAEMIQVFGTRWIPFGEEIGECSHPAKGYGIHGTPWVYDEENDVLKEDSSTIGGYEGDGCIRLAKEDIEELFSVVITKPTVIEIVSDYTEVELPGLLASEAQNAQP